MRSQEGTRRSTSALLYDENEEIKDAISDKQPLLGYTDSYDNGKSEPCYRRIYARYGLFRFSLLRKYLRIYDFISSCSYMDLLRFSLFIYASC
jgi:hypothetical protein